ncbi:MAG: Asp-tRNA(Asn)/Glu-tRNA(Gln) amidotransferase subunit GatB [Armatimonadetes bacterium]|nr:Asp-tRNA(Asn)/Glu-tRNA(Gln) amidotransferase subunit GatB [Armatimonadota bacterium]
MPEYESVIAMEVHAELLTASKMFCSCSAAFGAPPNTQVCPVCLGLPGSLPVMNRRAVEFVLKTALALNCAISSESIFHRKNYFYPDLPKGYQISQYGETPIGVGGYLDIMVDGAVKRVGIRRVHLEEDTGKLFHVEGGESMIDYNRCGVPLMEIVTDFPPDMRTPEEAREYLTRLRSILVYLGVCDGKMEQGSLRCEPNMSLRPVGEEKLGTRTEIKNLNSFRAVYRGLQYEIERQKKILQGGGTIRQETRRWDEAAGATAPMRGKEWEQEYRYFPEPDLVSVRFEEETIARVRSEMPELPDRKQDRFIRKYSLPAYDAQVLTASRPMAEFFEEAVRLYDNPKAVSNWVMGDLTRLLNAENQEIEDSKIAPAHLAGMLSLLDKGAITGKAAKTVFEEMFATGKTPESVVSEKGLTRIDDSSEIEAAVVRAIEVNPKVAEDIRGGKDKSIMFLVGQVMKETRGRANPEVVQKMLRERLLG